ncbi:MAG: hypothetical protein JWO82_2794 [Akkermansiaceae bacterium]|nr:hypothetical protein [Akkermansiaceae bacterium]
MKRSLLLAGFLAVCMSAIYALPALKITPSAMSTAIPEEVARWKTYPYQPTQKERDTLASDTEFSKAHCVLPRFEEASLITGECANDYADLSIVLSGEDLTNSIHRPERCMEAQGHKILESSPAEIVLPDGKSVATRRLVSLLESTDPKSGQHFSLRCLTYYFFVGHDQITANHSARNNIDMKDRLMKGEAQHWAYVLVTMPFAEGEQIQRGGPLLSVENADKKVQSLLGDLTEDSINWKMIAAR